MKILITRHNGIGDVIAAMPLAMHFAHSWHEVEFHTVHNNHPIINALYPEIKTGDLHHDPGHRTPKAEGFDRFINLDRFEPIDRYFVDIKHQHINIQAMYGILALQAGFDDSDLPVELSPSVYTNYQRPKNNELLIFSESTHESRGIDPAIVDQIVALKSKDYTVVVNPKYDSKLQLLQAIASAQQVIGCDSGPIHLAEATKTPWTCFHTTFDNYTRHKYYHYGKVKESYIECSPCHSHVGCGTPYCKKQFTIANI